MNVLTLSATTLLLCGCTAHIGGQDIARGINLFKNANASGFAAPRCVISPVQMELDRVNTQIAITQNEYQSAQARLSSNRAWDGQSCNKPEMKSLPPKPNALSEKEVAFQAVGSCTDTLSRRYPMVDVIQALSSVRMEEALKVGQLWSQSPKEECAMQQHSQVNDWVTKRLCAAFGEEAKWGCMQENLKACITKINSDCRQPITQWENQVAEIRSGPEVLLNLCNRDVQKIAYITETLPKLEASRELNAAELRKNPPKQCR